jgi:hypothetical protein
MNAVDDPENIRKFIASTAEQFRELEEEYPNASPDRQAKIHQIFRDAEKALESNVRRLQERERV